MARRSLRYYVKRFIGAVALVLGATLWLPLFWRTTGILARYRLVRYYWRLSRAHAGRTISTVDFPMAFFQEHLAVGASPADVADLVRLTPHRRLSTVPGILFAEDYLLPTAPGRRAELTALFDADARLVRLVGRNLSYDLGMIR